METVTEHLPPITFAENLRQVRAAKNVSQSELARRIGADASYICDLERGRRQGLSLKTAEKIAQALGVSMDTLTKRDSQKSLKNASNSA